MTFLYYFYRKLGLIMTSGEPLLVSTSFRDSSGDTVLCTGINLFDATHASNGDIHDRQPADGSK
jgi:hypothetical protein